MLRTPFYQYHVDRGARMVDFAGWEMPIVFTSIIEEHRHVRAAGGVFDVSHMGRIAFKGPDAMPFLDRICTRRVTDMAHGQCRYGLICNQTGGTKDDVLVYRHGDEDFLVVVNASNREKLLEHFNAHRAGLNFEMSDLTFQTAMLAVQGPKVMELLANVSSEIPALKKYRFTTKEIMGARMTVSRTGYTGEDGVELIFPAELAEMAVNFLMSDGGFGDVLKPIGLGARDTLRLEAGMPLYGHEMDEETDPISAGLMFGINLDKESHDGAEAFIGQTALKRIHEKGPKQKLVGFEIDGRRTPRQGMTIKHGSKKVGRVTSGGMSPTLDKPIAMGYVPAELAEPGRIFQIDLGKAEADAHVIKIPFYKAPRS